MASYDTDSVGDPFFHCIVSERLRKHNLKQNEWLLFLDMFFMEFHKQDFNLSVVNGYMGTSFGWKK